MRKKTITKYKRLAKEYYIKGLHAKEIAYRAKCHVNTVYEALKWARNNDPEIRRILPHHLRKKLELHPMHLPTALQHAGKEARNTLKELLSEAQS